MLARRPDTIPRRKSGKARIEAPRREARSSPSAHQGARVNGTDALRILLISQEPSEGEECNQENEDNPNIDAHQSKGLLPPGTRRCTGDERRPLWCGRGLQENSHRLACFDKRHGSS